MQEAGNGKEGIRVAKRIKPDLITLDLSLAKIQNAFEMNSTQMGL
jgi:chemotaxis response regulator CheB